jgi:peroxiredoxin
VRPIFFTLPLGLLFACVGALMYLQSLRPATAEAMNMGPKHPVTPEMQAAIDAMEQKTAPSFELPDETGKVRTLEEFHDGKPLLLYFIKDGCPCSIESEPLFQKLYRHHEGRVNVVGIIGSDSDVAAKWKEMFETPYPVLASPDHKVMQAYDVPRSVYTVLITPEGKIARMWGGYSARMLLEANSLLAALSDASEKPFEPDYAPEELSSGCSFMSDEE